MRSRNKVSVAARRVNAAELRASADRAALFTAALQKKLLNILPDNSEVVDKWNIHLIPRYPADSALSSIADKRPIFDLP